MRVLVVGSMAALALLGCSESEDSAPAFAPPAMTSPTAPSGTFADLPTGGPPERAYVIARSSVVFPTHSVDLEWDVDSLTLGSSEVLVYDGEEGGIHRVGERVVEVVTTAATSTPDSNGWAWIEGAEIVYPQLGERQPLPVGCCTDAQVVGIDFDMDPDIFVTSGQESWLWDTYEGGEGKETPPPESDDYLWPVGGLGRGTLVDTGMSSEVLVEYPTGRWGWGYVAGPRVPASGDPVPYEEQERVSADRVWLTNRAIIAVQPEGRLVQLDAEDRYDGAGHSWRELTGESTEFGLPAGLVIDGVVAERSADSARRWTILVDATDRTGQRAWVRCSLHSYACEIAAELGRGDITPE